MPLTVLASARKLTAAINHFRTDYHNDYSDVREIARQYLREAVPTVATVEVLAARLRCALRSWGAGSRSAPLVREVDDLSDALRSVSLHGQLKQLSKVSIARLDIGPEGRNIEMPHGPTRVAELDTTYISVLRKLDKRLLIKNTNVTYPMKAMLLITGFTPAFDSQVRGGLQKAGLVGMSSSQYSMPSDPGSANFKKLLSVPFILGQCWQQFREGALNSEHARLAEDPGRLFDVLLFMQGSGDDYRLFRLQPSTRKWYHIA